MTVTVKQGHVLDVLAGMPAKSVHVAVTSPPYWQLRAYGTPPQTWGDGWVCELGQEWSLDAFIGHLVEVFDAVGRVLRDDGTLWVNIADTYFTNPGGQSGDTGRLSDKAKEARREQGRDYRTRNKQGLKQGDLCMAPARFALAMQAAGWTLRSQIVLPKTSPMPESLQSTRWERCRVRLSPAVRAKDGRGGANPAHEQRPGNFRNETEATRGTMAEWADCPGCPKCSENEGYVQRWGSWRPTSAYEVLYLFSKAGQRYFSDGEGVRVPGSPTSHGGNPMWSRGPKYEGLQEGGQAPGLGQPAVGGRNLWNYVMWHPEGGLKEAHYASFPRFLPRLCIQAGTSEAGVCPTCGAPWLRVVERGDLVGRGAQPGKPFHIEPQGYLREGKSRAGDVEWRSTLGWRQSCRCAPHQPTPATVLDPFAGSGTTLIEANALGRHGIGVELQSKYVDIAHKRLSGQPLSLFAHEGAAEFAGAEVDALETTKQESHPNPTVRGFNQRWAAKERALREAAAAAPEAAG